MHRHARRAAARGGTGPCARRPAPRDRPLAGDRYWHRTRARGASGRQPGAAACAPTPFVHGPGARRGGDGPGDPLRRGGVAAVAREQSRAHGDDGHAGADADAGERCPLRDRPTLRCGRSGPGTRARAGARAPRHCDRAGDPEEPVHHRPRDSGGAERARGRPRQRLPEPAPRRADAAETGTPTEGERPRRRSELGGSGAMLATLATLTALALGAPQQTDTTLPVRSGARLEVDNLTAETVNGDITLRRIESSNAEANTVNGDITYDGTIKDGGRYRFATHDGSLRVSVPEKANVAVSVSTFNGEFNSCFPVQLTGKAKHRFNFTIGSGSARLELESFDGDIKICRPGAVSKEE